jgi:cation diffusion facilitator CzcD-associated flavoprotein CzcO
VRPSNGSTAAPQYHRYIVVGAGPGGLQIAHYLASAGRDYIVLDGGGSAGSFFHTFPRFRQLISINKRATGRSELDFNLRHDWNSLLSEASHSAQGTGDELGGAAGTEGECELLFCAASS